jgi:hypothetical protein
VTSSKPGEGTSPPIATGTFVRWPDGSGRVNMVVTSGKVPGVEGDVEGTASAPAARVVVWDKDASGGWSPTGKATATKMDVLKRIAPLSGGGSADGESAEAMLVSLHAHHKDLADEVGAPSYTVPDAKAVKTVFERGLASWPEEKALVGRDDWALSRVGAFLEMAAGAPQEGYERDVDMLPKAHPMHTGGSE